jgi:hypothetical protein
MGDALVSHKFDPFDMWEPHTYTPPVGGAGPTSAVYRPTTHDPKTHKPGHFWRLSVRDRQRILKQAGYDIDVDGLSGP